MITREFKLEKHPEFGTLGLEPLWMSHDQSDPLTGMGVAHDVLEHGDKDVCEWQGLGGAVYVRGSQGYFQRRVGNPDPAENIGSDFINLFHLWEGQTIPDPGRTYPVDDDGMIQDAVMAGCRMVREEFKDDDDRAKLARAWTNAEQRRRMVGWMRRGYRACAHRWRKHSGAELVEMFVEMEKRVDEFLKYYGWEGADVRMEFDIARRVCYLTLTEEE